ncbi:Tm-1-like ATP-binding domain-containing protein [Planctomicrobium sp. SH661]|uniref:Tm-1-like ATP-binding domain-containing protein n=1 Tax=Planctomicrobium sp. SH661 TaxID=3448124 RepID=UPI003F5B1010
MAKIAVLGTFDTKGDEHAFVAECLRSRGHIPVLIDAGTGAPSQITPDISREEVAEAGGINLPQLIATGDRGVCIAGMAEAAAVVLSQLHSDGKIDAAISLGGGGGTAIASAAMRSLPLGVPKLIVSTLASGNTAGYIGTSDLVLIPSIVDIAGLNRISKSVFSRAAGAICGMVEAAVPEEEIRPLIVASMFGNTTKCVGTARQLMEDAGYEVLVFAATGAGGRSMEAVIDSGMVAGVLDITTTEWADELVGGVLTAGSERLDAVARAKIPAILVPGCLDMVNFSEPETVPEKYAGRKFYQHNAHVTLMRTTQEECTQLGRILARKINAYSAPVSVLLPLRGVSVISAPGGPFHDPQADAALFNSIEEELRSEIPVIKLDCDINADEFAQACARTLLKMLQVKTP